MTAISARLVRVNGADLPYKVVIEHADMTVTEQPCASCRDGEALIRAAMAVEPAPARAGDPWNPPLLWEKVRSQGATRPRLEGVDVRAT